jgi:5'-3' exonuclease
MSNSDELVLVDGSGYIFRAYYALPPMHRSDGLPVFILNIKQIEQILLKI